uniref:DUF6678 family protein n=1 Tax=Aeromonas caviae TaxID=648 RepID=UPI002B471868
MDIRHREPVKEYVIKAGMTSVSNNSKWNRLFALLHQSNRFFQYRRTDLDGSTFPEDGESYTPELAQYWGNFWAMEFLDVLGCVLKMLVFCPHITRAS